MIDCNSLTGFTSILEGIQKKQNLIKHGKFGGRYFEINDKLFNLNQIVDCFHCLWPKTNEEIKLRPLILSQIKQIDKEASKKLSKASIFIKVATFVKSFFGKLWFNRKEVLDEISGAIQFENLKGERNQDKSITDSLQEKRKIIYQRGLPLAVNPAIPSKTYQVNGKIAESWIDACDEKYKDLARKFVGNIQHITFQQFEEQLKQCINKLNTCLNVPYSVGLVIGKSQQWVTSLSTQYLKSLPCSYFHLGGQGTILGASYEGKNNWVPENSVNVGEKKEDVLVIFDDCSYSGDQLVGNIYKIKEKLKTKKKLYLVVPFMTKKAKDRVEKWKDGKKLNIELITSDTSIKLVKDNFDENEQRMLKNVFLYCKGDHSLCYTDWRLPDATSTCSDISHGSRFSSMSENGKTKFREACETGEKVYPKGYFFQVTPEKIPRPYGLTKPRFSQSTG